MTRYAIVSKDNAYGLTRDAELLRAAIGDDAFVASARSRGFMDMLARRRVADVVVHLERGYPNWFSGAARNWLIPNQERFPRRHLRRLRRIDTVLAKTHHAVDIFRGLGANAVYLGFTSEDRLDPSVTKDWSRFFHLAGGSTLKGTEDILAVWAEHPEWPELVLVQKAENAPKTVPANVRLLSGYIDDAALKRLQNEIGIHLCPSRAEGWGHHIVEALSVGAVVVATDGPPMNEHVDADCGVLVAAARSEARHLGISHYVDRHALAGAVAGLAAMDDAAKAKLGAAARERYKAIDRSFRERVATLFG